MSEKAVSKQLNIIGASGHGKVVADIAIQCGYDKILFFDDDTDVDHCGAYPVCGTSEDVKDAKGDVFIAIGNASTRSTLMGRFAGKAYPVLIHPSAVVAEDAVIGEGTVVMAGSVINPGTTIGRGVIINTCSSVDHDCAIGDYVHIAVGSHICGTVQVGVNTWVGAGATVINNVSICDNCMIAAGSVVVKNIEESGTYAGVPAGLMERMS